jgi:ABC-type branched-subunit amino acid transport system substrate-binding protein
MVMTGEFISRRTALKTMASSAAILGAGIGTIGTLRAAETIKIGFLSGMTGLETILGETQLNCFKLAVEEINAAGAAGGRHIDFIVEDDQTTTRGAIDKARKLISQDKVDVIIGLIASLTHVAARSVTNPAHELLIYTTYYEGEVCDKYFFSTGQVPNQQIYPSVEWLTKNVGKSIYIVGSDYIWPKRSAESVKAACEKFGGKLLAAEFFPFGTQDFGPVLNRIQEAKPDIVWIMVAGSDEISIMKQYRSFGIKAQPFSNGFDDVFSASHADLLEGALANQAYFMTLDNPKNKAFVAAYRAKFGADKPINAIGEAAYDAAWLYALAVAKAGSTDVEKVIPALKTVEFDAPQGKVNFAANNVMRSNSLLARGQANGQWEIVKNFGQIDPLVPNCSL